MLGIVSILVIVEVVINIFWLLVQKPEKKVMCQYDMNYSLNICKGMEDYSYIVGFIYPFILVVICTIYAIKTHKVSFNFKNLK